MKKIILAITAISIIGISCNKSSNILPTKGAVNNESARSTENQEKAIGSFLTKYIHKENNANKRVFAEELPVETAVQEIENALNYEYAYNAIDASSWNDHKEFSVKIENVSTDLNPVEISNAYSQIIAKMKEDKAQFITENGTNDIHLALVDLSFTLVNNTVTITGTDFFTIKVVNVPNPLVKWTFDYTQGGWNFASKKGFWSSYTNCQYWNKTGAPEKLTQYAQHNLYYSIGAIPQAGYYTNIDAYGIRTCYSSMSNQCSTNDDYFIDDNINAYAYGGTVPSTTNVYHNLNVSDIGDNWMYYGIAIDQPTSTQSSMVFNKFNATCIPAYAMNYYTDNIVSFLQNTLPTTGLIQSGKVLIPKGFYINSETVFNNNNNGAHELIFKSGEFVAGPRPSQFPISL